MRKLIIGLVFFLIFIGLKINAVQAAGGHLVINEVYFHAKDGDGGEWIELYNPTNSAIPLGNYKIGDAANKNDSEAMYQFPSQEVLAKDYVVIATKASLFQGFYAPKPKNKILFEISGSDSNISNLTKYPSWGKSSFALNDTEDQVVLLDENDNVVDVAVWGKNSSWGTLPHKTVVGGHSLERQPKGIDTDNCALDFFDQLSPTPFLGVPSAVTLDIPQNILEESMDLVWTKISDSDFKEYQVYQAEDLAELGKNSPIAEIKNQSTENYQVEKLLSGKKYYFMVRTADDSNGFADSNIVFATTKFNYSKDIIVNEIFPHPSNGPDFEFIELYNNSKAEVDLSGWQLDDLVGSGSSPYLIPAPTIIQPESYLVFYKTTTKIALNDDGDEVNLLAPDDTVISSLIYGSAKEDQSYNYFSGEYLWSSILTPSAINQADNLGQAQGRKIISIAEAKNKPKNTLVQVEGTVSVPYGLFGKTTIYLQDSGSGIPLYYSKGLPLNLLVGDYIRVIGKMSSSNGEIRINLLNLASLIILGEKEIIPEKISIAKAESYLGRLVEIQGEVVETSGSTFYIIDRNRRIKIYLKTTTAIHFSKKKGDVLKIVGIVSIYRGELRVLPRFLSDITLLRSNAKKTENSSSFSLVEKAHAQEKLTEAKDYRGDVSASEKQKNSWYETVLEIAKAVVIVGFALLILISLSSRFHYH